MKKIINYIVLLSVLLSGFIVRAQTDTSIISSRKTKATFTGKIINEKTGEALVGASIYFPDLRIGTSSNEQGSFSIKNIPQGRFLLEVSYLGFSSVLESINLAGDVQRDFILNPSFVETEGVTVTGVSAATSIRRTPIPVNIVKKEDFMRGSSTNLIDALANVPGVSLVATGPAISKPFIRGLGYNRVVVVNDGIRQEGQQWGDEHGIEVDEYNVTKAEVLKGPASLMYGSDALAGVINFISITPVSDGSVKGNFFTSYQTNNRQRGLHTNIGGNHNGFIWGAYGSYKAAADYKNKFDGHVFNSKFNEKNFGGYLGFNKGWGYSRLYLSSFDQHTGLIEGERDSATGKFLKIISINGSEAEAMAMGDDFKSGNPFLPNQKINHFKLATENSLNIGTDRLTFTLGYQRNIRKEFANVLAPEESNLYFDLNTVNYNLQYHLAERNHWKTTIGVNGLQQSNFNKGEEVLIPEYSLFDIGVFLFEQKRFDKLTLSGGIRIDNRSLNSKGYSEAGAPRFQQFKKSFSNISGSAGLSYEPTNTITLKLNMARGFRAPSIPELASNGAHEGTNRFEYGEQNLKSETSLQFDAGIDIGTEHVNFSSNIFYNPIRNFIYYRKLNSRAGGDSIIDDGTEQYFAFRFNQNNARLYGVEFNLDIHPHPWDWLHVENTFSVVRGKLNEAQDGSRNLPFIPAPKLVNEIKVDFLKTGESVRNVYLKAELENTLAHTRPFTGFDTETKTPGYTLINAGIGCQVMCKSKPLFNIYFAANNLADVAYQSHLSRLKYAPLNNVTGRQGVFNMGRNFSIKLNVPFDFAANK